MTRVIARGAAVARTSRVVRRGDPRREEEEEGMVDGDFRADGARDVLLDDIMAILFPQVLLMLVVDSVGFSRNG